MSSPVFTRWVRRHTRRKFLADLSRAGCPVSPQALQKWLTGRASPASHRVPIILKIARGQLLPEHVCARPLRAAWRRR